MPYAEGTKVPVGRTRDEIERTLERFGASGQAWLRDDEHGTVTVAFKRAGRTYRLTLNMPDIESVRFTPTRKARTTVQAQTELEKETRRRFRSLANYIKAILDAVDSGIVTAEQALLPYAVLPGGATVGEVAIRQLESTGDVDLSRALPAGTE